IPLPTTSNNGITGTWVPVLNNTQTTTYTFTPDAGQCATTTTLQIVVNEIVVPTFDPVGTLCQNSAAPALPAVSNNGITGIWNPAVINTANVGTTTYTFTPDAGQCAVSTTLDVTIDLQITPVFTQIGPICVGAVAPALPSVSNNGISGVWNPAVINTAAAGTTTYTFTPDAGQCATASVTMDITISASITPTFDAVDPICAGATLTALPTTSNNGITGSWAPAFDNTQTTTYTFTPDPGQCATTTTPQALRNDTVAPTFDSVDPICAGAALDALPTTSNNGITGSWAPAINNTQTTTYTFSPDPGQCATTTTLQIVVNDNVVPTFDPIGTLCQNSTAPSLPTVSNNEIGRAHV